MIKSTYNSSDEEEDRTSYEQEDNKEDHRHSLSFRSSHLPPSGDASNNNKRKSLLETFSSRTRLQFKAAQVLLPDDSEAAISAKTIQNNTPSSDEAYESEDERSSSNGSNRQHSHNRWAALDQPSSSSSLQTLSEQQQEDEDHRTLYERLLENKLKKQKEIEEQNAPKGPKSLDEDDVHYLREQEELMKEKEREIKKQEEEEIAKYLKGEMDRGSVNTVVMTVLDDKEDTNTLVQDSPENRNVVELNASPTVLPISDLQVVEVKKRKRNETTMTNHSNDHNAKKKKNNKKNASSTIVNSHLLEYDSS
ncbi:hypothetical protein FDP41_005227 [Naegleria fowleri]|uniref:FAM192A/Fyv6 N-terminal domain-containing protein n=1 Tax=Naegleria fowleri TaxID=5763 RepID=A0A6A5BPP5_NAEFO|nr:uncharacterized protein FDP41_005227 [Naegleria fowleri]KAF0975900.1 hypothetical protein FDP41_005227 [Naegleria fowleri]